MGTYRKITNDDVIKYLISEGLMTEKELEYLKRKIKVERIRGIRRIINSFLRGD
jgi:hypothetical protein